MRRIQFGRQVISRGAADAERPKLHLQPVVDVAHQGAHRQDLRKQELRTTAKIKVMCELYLQNIVHFATEPPRESTAKNTRKASSFADFPQFSTTCRRVEFILRNFAIYCKSLSFSQQTQCLSDLARFSPSFFRGSIAKHIYFRRFSHVFASMRSVLNLC